MSTALLFPGQGSFSPDARQLVAESWPELLERCCALVGADPFARADESTRFAQPATFCASMAAWRRLDEPTVVAAAGHSLGELGALAAAGTISIEDALELVVRRGGLMAEAGEATGAGGMLALLRATPEQAEELAAAHGATVANDNAPGQLVLSGPHTALRAAAGGARTLGVRAMELDVTGAFHSPAMAAAVEPFREAVRAVELCEPRFPVLSGLTGAPFAAVAEELAGALVGPVRWRETILALADRGIDRFLDVGPGRVLARLTTRIVPAARALAVEELHGVGA